MGLFDSIKNVFGKTESGEDFTVAPSQMLREAGVDPEGLQFGFDSDGTITVSGSVSDESDRQMVMDTLSGIPGINRVEDQITLTPAATAEEAAPVSVESESDADEPETTAPETTAPEAPAPTAASGRSYTVQSGDTLWKIADEMYGNGSNYMKIFDANSELLEHPDRIFPGQELTIPNLED